MIKESEKNSDDEEIILALRQRIEEISEASFSEWAFIEVLGEAFASVRSQAVKDALKSRKVAEVGK